MPGSPHRRSRENSSEHPYLHIAKARRRCAVTGAHRLHRLAFAAIGSAPQNPMLFIRDRVAAVPKVRSDPGVGAVLQQAALFAVLDFVADLGAELKVEAHVIDA